MVLIGYWVWWWGSGCGGGGDSHCKGGSCNGCNCHIDSTISTTTNTTSAHLSIAFVRLAAVLNSSRGAIGKCMLRGGVGGGGGEQDKSHHNP